MAFIPVTDVATARSFYESTLGLSMIDDSPFALVVDANGTKVRITPVPDLGPHPFTILGWEVAGGGRGPGRPGRRSSLARSGQGLGPLTPGADAGLA